jgi:hypothetical protein
MAALAVAVLACTLFGSIGLRAGEQLQLAAGPGDSPGAGETAPGESPGSSATAPGESAGGEAKDAGPGDAAAAPEKAEPEAGRKSEEAAEPADEKGKAEAAPAGGEAEQPADKEEGKAETPPAGAAEQPADKAEGDKAAAPASAESVAAAEKVKKGDIPVPTDPVALAAFDALERNCSRCHQAGPTLKREAGQASQEFRQHPPSRRSRQGSEFHPSRQPGWLQALHSGGEEGDALRLLPGIRLQGRAEREGRPGDL